MKSRGLAWYWFGLANLVIVLALSLGFWYLLIDPTTSVVKSYPEPFDEMLFWAILIVVFLGFNLEFHWFDRLRQPVKGLALIAVTVALAMGITFLFEGWGHYDPAFSTGVAMGNGYFLAALFVLFGFFTYLTVVINWEHWPWPHKGLKQPWVGIAEIGTVTGPTVVIYALFALPNLARWAKPGHNVLDVPTTIGVVYSIIIVAIITGLMTENWPWRLAGAGGRQALASLVGNIAGGVVLYFLLRLLVQAIVGSGTKTLLGMNFNEYPAQIGVCWVFWMILWSNVFDNRPTGFSMAANYVIRTVWTLALGIGTFALYTYAVAQHVLHEPVVAGKIYGSPLGWMDWLVLWILFYVVYLESYGLPKPREAVAETEAAEPTARQPEASRAGPVAS